MNPILHHARDLTRRTLLGRGAAGLGAAGAAGMGIGNTALTSMLRNDADGCHHTPKAKRVIFIVQNGGPSHVDLFDDKPMLRQMHGTQIPDSIVGGRRFSSMTGGQSKRPCLRPIQPLPKRGQNGATVSNLLPYTAAIADKLCFVKSMHTTQVNHAPAITFLMTGSERPGRPSMGAWLSYGLGRSCDDLPTFVSMTSRDKEASCGQIFYDYYWGSGFLLRSDRKKNHGYVKSDLFISMLLIYINKKSINDYYMMDSGLIRKIQQYSMSQRTYRLSKN